MLRPDARVQNFLGRLDDPAHALVDGVQVPVSDDDGNLYNAVVGDVETSHLAVDLLSDR